MAPPKNLFFRVTAAVGFGEALPPQDSHSPPDWAATPPSRAEESFLEGFALHTSRIWQVQSVLIARAARIASTMSEISAWIIMSSLARCESTVVSVGLKAVLVLKARNR